MYLFMLERRKGTENGRERNIDVRHTHDQFPLTQPPGDLACNLGMCLDGESNWRPFSLQVGAQFIQPHQLGGLVLFVYELERCGQNIWLQFLWGQNEREN